jgi:hypothetical protein
MTSRMMPMSIRKHGGPHPGHQGAVSVQADEQVLQVVHVLGDLAVKTTKTSHRKKNTLMMMA